jgi:Rrf2 family protein
MMSLSAEYALRATVCVAGSPRGAPMTTQQIADVSHIPVGYLAKVMQTLVRGGLVSSQRGVNGGFTLARSAEQISLWDVVRLEDGSSRIEHCPLGIAAHGTALCPLHRKLDRIAATAESMLAEVSIAEMVQVANAKSSKPTCRGPSPRPAALVSLKVHAAK